MASDYRERLIRSAVEKVDNWEKEETEKVLKEYPAARDERCSKSYNFVRDGIMAFGAWLVGGIIVTIIVYVVLCIPFLAVTQGKWGGGFMDFVFWGGVFLTIVIGIIACLTDSKKIKNNHEAYFKGQSQIKEIHETAEMQRQQAIQAAEAKYASYTAQMSQKVSNLINQHIQNHSLDSMIKYAADYFDRAIAMTENAKHIAQIRTHIHYEVRNDQIVFSAEKMKNSAFVFKVERYPQLTSTEERAAETEVLAKLLQQEMSQRHESEMPQVTFSLDVDIADMQYIANNLNYEPIELKV